MQIGRESASGATNGRPSTSPARRSRATSPFRQCHQLKTGAFVLCEKTAKQMQLVGAGLCSARQNAPNHRKSSANSYASAHFGVGADDSVRPQDAVV